MSGRVAIIGAGPAGLGAAWELQRQGHEDFTIFEQRGEAGGLASSELHQGHWFDFGGHVLYVRNAPFKAMLDELFAPDELLEHPQRRRVAVCGTTVPYPIQRHIEELPEPWATLALHDKERLPAEPRRDNFLVYLLDTFGPALCQLFFLPYNRRLWRVPLQSMSCDWLSDLVPKEGGAFDCPRLYPAEGGIGEVWRRLAGCFDGKVRYGHRIDALDKLHGYAAVVSSAPLIARGLMVAPLSVSYVVGTWSSGDSDRLYVVGSMHYVAGGCPTDREAYTLEWNGGMPEGLPGRHQSFAYPVPTLDRDEIVTPAIAALRRERIWSIGRFGNWRYETGHMDQCFLQGVQAAQEVLDSD